MIRYLLFIILFVLFLIEGTVFQIFAPDQYGVSYLFIPRWVFLVIIFTGIYRGRGAGTLYAVIFGVLYDVIYSSVLGIYTFSMGLIAYLFSISIPFFQRNLTVAILTSLAAITLLDYFIYGMMLIIGLASISHEEFLTGRFIPSFLMNALVIIILAYPLRKLFYFIKRRSEENDKL
ncbi:rod shape-determining protein MreD [Evansella cellulosilytica]|uniref:Rod shape-determining protein MreD n=1 Tax=Evansella cellulosilytica (strain ATCC 21833 / DSM 2522 / FERM P-1141 / JCM 9156 / N-4) TaxID=649639 RepID=E6TYU9_EVAC2|nr:rod shape-determining protein MreD [Evansella cellulosilytica]ADU31284.1 rod shape-determining protein MreD [Evansella cellulosilytica DSM 2522]